MDGPEEIQRILLPVETKTDMQNAFPSLSNEFSTGKEKEEEVVPLSPEELVPDVCRIDGVMSASFVSPLQTSLRNDDLWTNSLQFPE